MPAKTATPTTPTTKVTCAICGKHYRAIDARHLRVHGMTVATYRRTYPRAPLTPAEDITATPQPLSRSASLAVAEALVTDPEFVRRMAHQVSQTIFGSSLRDQLRLALCSTLSARMELHGRAVAHLQQVREELSQPWRIRDGGKDGAPTPTPHLVAMAGEAHHEVAKTEEALLRAIRLAAEEQRHHTQEANLHGRPAFTGEAEVIPVPPELSPGERETVRSLLGLLRQEMAARANQRRALTPATTTDNSRGRHTTEGHTPCGPPAPAAAPGSQPASHAASSAAALPAPTASPTASGSSAASSAPAAPPPPSAPASPSPSGLGSSAAPAASPTAASRSEPRHATGAPPAVPGGGAPPVPGSSPEPGLTHTPTMEPRPTASGPRLHPAPPEPF